MSDTRHFMIHPPMSQIENGCVICGKGYDPIHDVEDPICKCKHRSGLHESHDGPCYFPQCKCNRWEFPNANA